jgi:hypothetical protein
MLKQYMDRLGNTAIIILAISLFSCNSSSKKPVLKPEAKLTAQTDQKHLVDSSKNKTENIYKTNQQNTKLFFTCFTVNLHDFLIYSNLNGLGELNYNGDTSEVTINIDKKNSWSARIKKDTLHLNEDPDNSFRDNLIEILSLNKKNRFSVSYSLGISLDERMDRERKIRWTGNTEYKRLTDSAGCFFKVPLSEYDDAGKNEIKKRLNLSDTLVIYPGEFEEKATLIYKNRPCIFTPNTISLRIERFVGNTLKETKFITIHFDQSG